jgi:hypothetical protein
MRDIMRPAYPNLGGRTYTVIIIEYVSSAKSIANIIAGRSSFVVPILCIKQLDDHNM